MLREIADKCGRNCGGGRLKNLVDIAAKIAITDFFKTLRFRLQCLHEN